MHNGFTHTAVGMKASQLIFFWDRMMPDLSRHLPFQARLHCEKDQGETAYFVLHE